jgi:hypothetical protein
MAKTHEEDPNEVYGRTRGVEAYHSLVDRDPRVKDRTVLQIADKALQVAVFVDKREDITPETAARATVKAITRETFTGQANNETG